MGRDSIGRVALGSNSMEPVISVLFSNSVLLFNLNNQPTLVRSRVKPDRLLMDIFVTFYQETALLFTASVSMMILLNSVVS